MTEQQSRLIKFSYFLLGVTVPLAGYLLWSKSNGFRFGGRKEEIDRAHDITVEDSFPASDPPSAW